MRKMLFSEYQLSRLMLGTAQFGMPYGIANITGRPSYETVRDILACAYEGGVNCLDTAASYGESEKIIGKALTELGIADRVIVITKVCHMKNKYLSRQDADNVVLKSVTRSLKRLRLDALPFCIFHNEYNFRYIDSLIKLKDKGLVRHVGVSVSTQPGAAESILKSGTVEALQIPTNILDHRHRDSGIFKAARQRNVATFVRSVYLQGLILMHEANIPLELQPVIPIRRKLQTIANEAGMSMAELAVRYVLSVDGVTCVLAGVESLKQMRQNLALFSKGQLSEDLMKSIIKAVPRLPDSVITPTIWQQ